MIDKKYRSMIEKKEDGSIFFQLDGWFTRHELEDLITEAEEIRRDESVIRGTYKRS